MARSSASESPQRAEGARKGDRVVVRNRKAFHEYHIEERLEAGLVLTGTEVKSLRQGRANLVDSYAAPQGDELYLFNLHISLYDPGNRFNHEPTRKRKLLLHRREIRRLAALVDRSGYTLVPLDLHFVRGYAKVTLGVARGKRAHDKRRAIAERESRREVQRALRERQRDRS